MLLPDRLIKQFLAEHRLPESFRSLIRDHYLPLAEWICRHLGNKSTPLLGINGAQGTGKSTQADFLKLALEHLHQRRVAVMSIDDFYLTKAERLQLANTVHPLLATRGAPGTHDSKMLQDALQRLRELPAGEELCLPRFDKALDDRADEREWSRIEGRVDLIVLEGWCIGSVPESSRTLRKPLNVLERDEDPDCIWRRYVNERLRCDYSPIFRQLDALVFLKAPDFDSIFKWRLRQERKLADSTAANAQGIMNADEIARFIQYYERITRNNLDQLPVTADVIFELDDDQQIASSHYRSPATN